MDNVRIGIENLSDSINHISKAINNINELSSTISSVDLSGSDLTTKGNVPRAATVVETATHDIKDIAKNLGNTRTLLERMNNTNQ